MESWLQRLFLTLALCASGSTLAQESEISDDETILEGVINPDLKRRKIDESKIDSENFEMGMYTGVLSIEDFGTNSVYGMRGAMHFSEFFFLESVVGTSRASETSYETLSGGTKLLTDIQREYIYYNLSLGLNVLSGEVFIGKRHAFNTSYYLIGGMGNTHFAGNEYLTMNFGAGFRLYATDWVSLRMGFRNHLFTHNIFGVDKSIQNLEANMGLSLYF